MSSTFNIFASKILEKKSYATQAPEGKEAKGMPLEETVNVFNLRRADTSVRNCLLFFVVAVILFFPVCSALYLFHYLNL